MEDTDMFTEMRAAGSHIPDMVEFLRANGWQSYKHHDNWVKKEWSTREKDIANFDLHDAYKICLSEQQP